jgi:hypothetical protein
MISRGSRAGRSILFTKVKMGRFLCTPRHVTRGIIVRAPNFRPPSHSDERETKWRRNWVYEGKKCGLVNGGIASSKRNLLCDSLYRLRVTDALISRSKTC